MHLKNSWDLKSCKQEPGESLRDYIRRFSKQCNSLPDVVDTNIVSAFLSRATCKSLVHKLGSWKPRTTRELLDIATNHASSEEVAVAVFTDGRAKGKAKREDQDDSPSSRQEKRKKDDRHRLNAPTDRSKEQTAWSSRDSSLASSTSSKSSLGAGSGNSQLFSKA
jgi:hypothetical protein